jgi:hypothetical protein
MTRRARRWIMPARQRQRRAASRFIQTAKQIEVIAQTVPMSRDSV